MAQRKNEKRNSLGIWRRYKDNKIALVALCVLSVIASSAILAPFIADYDTQVIEQHSTERLQGPSEKYWFGTDAYGRDVFARIIYGARVSLLIGIGTTTVCLIVSLFLGSVSGYYGGRIDNIIMRTLDMVMSIPAILLALSIVAALGAGMRNLMIALIISGIPRFTRIIRSSVLTVIGEGYIEAAKSFGAREYWIILIHVLPNAMGPIIVQATMNVAGVIMAAAGLSFIGMGIEPPAPEWGAMLSESKEYMRYAPHTTIFPGFAIVITALSLNLVGDGLRDSLDPKLKN